LLDGRPGPLPEDEYIDWQALSILEQEERERAEKKAKAGGRRGRRR
jgi:hypothetical protein